MIQVQIIIENKGFTLGKVKLPAFNMETIDTECSPIGNCVFNGASVIVYHDHETDTKTTFVKQMHVGK